MQDFFKDFPPEREEVLSSIQRYKMFDTMWYRSSVFLHARRAALIVEDLKKEIKKSLPKADAEKAYTLALVHDDAEMITGDIQRGHKHWMTDKELQELDNDEEKAIDMLAKKYPKKVNNYSYKNLLTVAMHKNTQEAHIVNYADKLDAFCECMHEVFASNIQFIGPLLNYYELLTHYKKKFIKIDALFEEDHPFLNLFKRVSPLLVGDNLYAQLNKPHTKKSIKEETDFPPYNRWREIVLKNMPDGEKILTHHVPNPRG